MALTIVKLLFGVFLLLVGAELLIRSSVQIALRFRVPKLVIGLTIVAFATSLPEALASVFGQIKGAGGDIALGNVLGSNIANIGLVLGIYLLLRPCKITQDIKWQRIPLMLFVYLLVFLVMLGGKITRLEGIFLFLALILYIFLQFFLPTKKEDIESGLKIHDTPPHRPLKTLMPFLACIASIVLLVLGAKLLVDRALILANYLNLSERVIAITVVALGTSLPELATAVVAARRREKEVFVGTIIGSNIFNPLLIIPAATFIKPIYFSSPMITIDYPVMIFFGILLWVLMALGKNRLTRLDGSILLLGYLAYIAVLFI